MEEFSYKDIASSSYKNRTLTLTLLNGKIVRYENVEYDEYLQFMKEISIYDALSVFEECHYKPILTPHQNKGR